jgi:hypothetical protein
MPVDGSGNFTRAYSWVADKTGGVKIIASRMDGEFDNYANALNQVFWRSGLVSMTGNLPMGGNTILGLGNGSAGTPATRFAADTSSGLYLIDVARVGLSAGGNQRLEANGTGVLVNGTLGVSGNTTLSGALEVTGSATVGGTLTVGSTLLLANAGFMFANDGSQDTGMRWISDGVFAARSNGVDIITIGGGTTNVTGTLTVGSTLLLANAGFMFANDGSQDTGMRWISDGVFAARSNGVDIITIGGGSSINTAGNAIIGGDATVAGTFVSTGAFTASSTSNLRGTVRIGTTGHGNIGSDTNTLYLRGDNIAWQNGAATDTRAYLNNAGNFGIGRGAPAAKLDVNGSVATFDGGFLYTPYNASTNTGTVRAGIQFDGASQAVNLYTSDTYRGGISNVGNWGIGQGPGSQRLSVNGGVVAGAYYAGAGQGIWFSGAGLFTCGVASNGTGNQLDLYTSNTARFSINSDGGITSSNLADAVGYKGLPQNQRTGAYTLGFADMGGHVYTTAGTFAVTIPANSTTAFPVGAAITVINEDAVKTITPAGGVTLVQAGTGATGTRTLAVGAMATLIKVQSDRWYISGAGVT